MPRNFYRSKIMLAALFVVSFSISSFAQRKVDSYTIVRGHCNDILIQIQDSTKCDSVAALEFMRYYKFENGNYFPVSQWRGALAYIRRIENNQLFCILKDSIREFDLIGDPPKEADERKLKYGSNSLK